ncbi:N-acetyltransferase [Chitinophaga ginsengisoli]|uniref:Spermine/spermidine N-acetyltransferase n=1 Tax=Chitinophaga ginsengisoli TaxID=363837 RepID=A0A2P8G2K6_9BACT|nr:N-acetyltransferase [Chitinophaga ginsengisoli]PSL28201.1 spermine/spermidine N-acetyltransferase [Chitinophaga ginsengisoli]
MIDNIQTDIKSKGLVKVNRIVTNSCIGTEQNLKLLMHIGAATAREKYTGKVPVDQLEGYIQTNFSYQALRIEVNSMANQFLVVWVNGEVAGYARVTSKGQRPEILQGKSVIRIADFRVLERFNEMEVKNNLFERSLSLCHAQQITWISEFADDVDIAFWESYGFVHNAAMTGINELGLPVVCLLRNREEGK